MSESFLYGFFSGCLLVAVVGWLGTWLYVRYLEHRYRKRDDEVVEVMPVPSEWAVERVRAEMHSLALAYGPNWERLDDTDADAVALRLARAALEDG
jgi:hypothetical protein